MSEYNKPWCDERHKKIDEEFTAMWAKIKTFDTRLWAIIILLVFNFGGIIAVLLKTTQ